MLAKCTGEASDKFISLLDPHLDCIMVDKGFLIDEVCQINGIRVIQPPFLRKDKQFTKENAQETASIASARVHV